MLGKLLKYEMKSTSRLLGIIYLAILVIAVVIGFSCRALLHETFVDYAGTMAEPTPGRLISSIILLSIYVILIVAMVIITYYFIIERFYKSMLKGEGYLMHTLPVSTWELVATKTISGFVWSILGTIVVFLSVLLIMTTGGVVTAFLPQILEDFGSMDLYLNIGDGLLIVSALIESVRLILTFYVAMAIGGAAKRHKLLYSVLAFIVIVIIIRVIGAAGNFGLVAQLVTADSFDDPGYFPFHSMLVKSLIMNLILSVVFFFGTTFFLQKKLNLE